MNKKTQDIKLSKKFNLMFNICNLKTKMNKKNSRH